MFHNNTASLSYSDSERRTNNSNPMNLLMFEKVYVYENILLVGPKHILPTNPIYGRAFALHRHYVPVPLGPGNTLGPSAAHRLHPSQWVWS